jgi:hypothetical protein
MPSGPHFPPCRIVCLFGLSRGIQIGRGDIQKGKQIDRSINKGGSRTRGHQLGRRTSGTTRQAHKEGGVDQRQQRLSYPKTQTRQGGFAKLCHCGERRRRLADIVGVTAARNIVCGGRCFVEDFFFLLVGFGIVVDYR